MTEARIWRCSRSSCSALVERGVAVVRLDVACPMPVLGPERVDQLEVAGPLFRELLDPLDRRLGGGHPGMGLLVVVAESATTPSAWMTSGSVRPWPTSVARITEKVRKITRSRSGNGSPVGERERQGQRSRERHDAAHPGPRDDEDVASAADTARSRGSPC